MADQDVVERLQDEVTRLRTALEAALVFALDVEAGMHGEQTAVRVAATISEALDEEGAQAQGR